MTDTERIIYKDRVQSLALSLLQNATVQADTNDTGVELRIEFVGFGKATLPVPFGIEQRYMATWLKIEIGYILQELCRQRYFR